MIEKEEDNKKRRYIPPLVDFLSEKHHFTTYACTPGSGADDCSAGDGAIGPID